MLTDYVKYFFANQSYISVLWMLFDMYGISVYSNTVNTHPFTCYLLVASLLSVFSIVHMIAFKTLFNTISNTHIMQYRQCNRSTPTLSFIYI